MAHYVIDRDPQKVTGENLVHHQDCAGFPTRYHDLGWQPDGGRALEIALRDFPHANACVRCCAEAVEREEPAPERPSATTEAISRFRGRRPGGLRRG